MSKGLFWKKVIPAVKNDVLYTVVATVLFVCATLVTKRLHLVPTNGLSVILYLLPLLVLLVQQADKALNDKTKEPVNRHWILLAVSAIMFGSGFIVNADPHFSDTVVMLLIYSFGEIITKATLTIVQNPLHGKRGHSPVITERDGIEEKMKPELLKTGDIVTIKRGETVPTDGYIREGSTTFTSVTDRNVTKTFNCGDMVYAGYLNKGETVKIEVSREFSESSTAIIIDATYNNEWPKAVETAKVISKHLILLTLPLALLTSIAIPMMAQWFLLAFPRWLYRALLLVAIASTDTIAFSLPIAVAGTFARLLRNDIVINRYKLLDKLPKIRSIVFDADLLGEATLTPDDVKEMRRAGIKHITMMSSGSEEETKTTAKALDLRDYHYEMQHDDKSKLIKRLYRSKRKGSYLAAIGNGTSDRTLLQLANIRIAMTQPDNSTAIESNDVSVINGKFDGISTAIKNSKKVKHINMFNLCIAVASKVILLALAFLGMAPVWALAAADVAILLATSLNALRTL